MRLWSVQVVGPTQSAVANLLAGLDYIFQHTDQISVVNASLGVRDHNAPAAAIHQAVSNIVNQGVVFIASAGNETADISGDLLWGTDDDLLPAAFAEAVAVGAMNPTNDTSWTRSNFSLIPHDPAFVTSPGAAIDVAAPGVNIFSTYKGSSYTNMTGTSMASPHVAGLVALYIAANGRATNAAGVYKIRQAIVDNSLAQSQWSSFPNTGDPDGNPEPLAMPSENWVPTPQIVSQSQTPGGFEFSFPTVPGYRYTAQYQDSLSMSNDWTDLASTNGTGSLTTVTLSDPTPSTTRFYRLQRQPAP